MSIGPDWTAWNMRASIEAAMIDAARWRWVLARNPTSIAAIAWSVREACVTSDPVEAVDIARKAEPSDA